MHCVPSEEKNIDCIHILLLHCYLPYDIWLRLRHPAIMENGTVKSTVVCEGP